MNFMRFNKSVKFLKPAFLQLEENFKQYGDVFEWEELPYFFNERATLSILQAACWQAGLISMEEYVTRKYGAKNKATFGRCDIYIGEKNGKNAIEFEAKQKWPTPKFYQSSVRKWLEAGDKDANRNRNVDVQASLTFVVPELPHSVTEEMHVNMVNKVVRAALEAGIDGFHVWSSNQSWEHRSTGRSSSARFRWPSLITLVRISRTRGVSSAYLRENRLSPSTKFVFR